MKFHVTEGSVETVIPIAANTSFADNWDVTAAFRGTSYQLSGYVSTWKVGSATTASTIRRAVRSSTMATTSDFNSRSLGA